MVGKEGRAAQAAGLEAALGPPRPTWMAASTLQDGGCDARAAEGSQGAGGLPQAMKHVGVRVCQGQGSRGMERHLSGPRSPA